MRNGSRRTDRPWHRLAGAVLAGALAASCAGGAGDGGEQSEPDDGPSADEGEIWAATPHGPFPVGRRTFELVDASRPTPAVPEHGLAATDERRMPVTVVYPAADTAEDADEHRADAEGSRDASELADAAAPAGTAEAPAVEEAPVADGRFPLVVFAHGVNNLGDYFFWLAEHWARDGYVVAVPTFPVSRAPIAHFDDYVNQPGDVSFVIDEILARNDDNDDPLAGHIDDQRVAVGGYSLGAVTVLGVTMNSCCLDERVDAAIAVAGGPLPYDGGDYDDPPAMPLLIVHGALDTAAPIAAGDAVFDMAQPPVHYLRLAEADHVNIFGDELLRAATSAFLDAYLKDEPDALDTLPATVEATGRGELRRR